MRTKEKIDKLVQIVNHPDYYQNTTKEYRIKMIGHLASLARERLRELSDYRKNEIEKV